MFAQVPLWRFVLPFYIDDLGINPYDTLIAGSGYWAMLFTLLSLAITPVRRWLTFFCARFRLPFGKRLADWNFIVRARRMVGLYAFFYAVVHTTIYLYLDLAFDWDLWLEDLSERQFLVFGSLALLLLVPLAITSPNFIKRRMGKQWRRLHRLSYVVGVLVIVHWLALAKMGEAEVFIYAGVLTLLLLHRCLAYLWPRFKRIDDDGMLADRGQPTSH